MSDAQAVLPHVLDMLGPWIDERHVLAGLHHVCAGIPADGTRSDDRYLPTHAFLPHSRQPRLARLVGSSQMVNPLAPGAPGHRGWLVSVHDAPVREKVVLHNIDSARHREVDIEYRSIHMKEQRKLFLAIGVSRNATP